MAQFVLTDAVLTVAAVDLSDHVKSVTLNYSSGETDDTAMGATALSRLGTLLDWSLDVEFMQDYASNEVDATLFSLVGTSVALTVKPTSAATSATNPEFQGNGILLTYPPLSGSVGELAMTSVNFAGNGALTRATS